VRDQCARQCHRIAIPLLSTALWLAAPYALARTPCPPVPRHTDPADRATRRAGYRPWAKPRRSATRRAGTCRCKCLLWLGCSGSSGFWLSTNGAVSLGRIRAAG
jgi:hypothetical protein